MILNDNQMVYSGNKGLILLGICQNCKIIRILTERTEKHQFLISLARPDLISHINLHCVTWLHFIVMFIVVGSTCWYVFDIVTHCFSRILTNATSTLSRINLKTQLLARKRIKCSRSTLIIFKLFRCPHWNAASAPERRPDNLVPRAFVRVRNCPTTH